MTTPFDLFLTVNSLRLHLRDWGGDGRPLILIHGLASNAKIWDWVAPILANQYRVVALDQRSHGLSQSPSPSDGYEFDSVCSDLRGVVSQLNFNKPILVGHSWGASVALEYAARYPDAMGGAVLVDGGFLTMGKRMTWPEAEARLAPPRLAGTPLAALIERIKAIAGDRFSDSLLEIVLGNFEILPDDTVRPHLAFDSHMKIVRAMWEENAEQLYPQVKCPTLFLPAIPPQPYEEMAEEFLRFKREGAALARTLLPGARIEWLADSIHDVPVQRPELVAKKVVEFLESVK